jgi:hypothetical protein
MAAMEVPANRDEAALAEVAARLADAVEAVVPDWVERSVAAVVAARGGRLDTAVAEAAAEAGARAGAEVAVDLRRLLAADVDAQWTNPLSILRAAVRHPTAVLRDAGVPPLPRDAFDERHFPDDDYGLTPRAFADVDPELHELGLVWGALKARVHLSRHGHKRTMGHP